MIPDKRVLTAAQSKALDVTAQDKLGISVLVLMENAGKAVADEVIKALRDKKRIAVICGKGNNGGDGFVAARHLLASRIKPDVYLAGKISEVGNEARKNLEILLKLKQKIIQVNEENVSLVKKRIAKYDLIVDALLGVGVSGEARGSYKDLIHLINSSRAFIVSVDVPSGLDATTGKILGSCVKADETVTFVAKKRGMIFGNGPKYCGKIVVRNLGVPI